MLSIIIVNYKSAGLILDCLSMLYRKPGDYPFEVLIVDNASGDNSQQQITTAFPQVTWISVDYNSGFARANNVGIRQSAGDAVLLLNADTLPEASTITTAYARLQGSSFVAAGIQLQNLDRSPQISGMYFMKGGLNYLLPLPWLGTVIKSLGQAVNVKKPHVSEDPAVAGPIPVDWINGAFLMVKRSAIEKAGLLDEDFFLYAEEAEWCSRLRRTGPLCIYSDLHMIHLQGETANQEFGSGGKGYYDLYDRKGLQIMLSNFVRIRKQFGVGWFLIQLICYLTEIPVMLGGVTLTRIFTRNPRYTYWHFGRFCKNVGTILRLSPTIIQNKPYFYKVL